MLPKLLAVTFGITLIALNIFFRLVCWGMHGFCMSQDGVFDVWSELNAKKALSNWVIHFWQVSLRLKNLTSHRVHLNFPLFRCASKMCILSPLTELFLDPHLTQWMVIKSSSDFPLAELAIEFPSSGWSSMYSSDASSNNMPRMCLNPEI